MINMQQILMPIDMCFLKASLHVAAVPQLLLVGIVPDCCQEGAEGDMRALEAVMFFVLSYADSEVHITPPAAHVKSA